MSRGRGSVFAALLRKLIASQHISLISTIDSFMACSWNSGTPSVRARIASTSFDGYVTGSSPFRRRRNGCTISPTMGPGRMIAISITRS